MLGTLPEWVFGDLYPGRDSPELARDLTQLTEDAEAFRKQYEGRLAQFSGAALVDRGQRPMSGCRS